LEQQRPSPLRPDRINILPSHARVEQGPHLASQLRCRLWCVSTHVIAEGQARQLLPHGPPPGGLARKRQHLRGAESGWNRESIDDVSLALADELIVQRQHQPLVAAGLGAGRQLTGKTAVFVDEDLHPALSAVFRCQRLQSAHRSVAQAIHRAMLLSSLG